jgi:hypothetical protein
MGGLTYEWKVDIALLLAIITLAINAGSSLLRSRAKRKADRIRVYEKMYEDACFLLEYHYHKQNNAVKAQAKYHIYCNDDLQLQTAVRGYISSHTLGKWWVLNNYILPTMTGDERLVFMELVLAEAQKHQDELSRYRIDLQFPELSPAYHLKDQKVERRLARIIKYVGENLSSFSPEICRSWEAVRFEDPMVVIDRYAQALQACPHYFEHNPRDFDDPFYDLPWAIRQEYQTLTQKRGEVLKWKGQRYWYRTRRRWVAHRSKAHEYALQTRASTKALSWKCQRFYSRIRHLIRHQYCVIMRTGLPKS